MLSMGRPRERNKDLPRGLYRDGKGRFYLKAFTPEDRARLGGKSSKGLGRDVKAARIAWAEVFGFRDSDPAAAGTFGAIIDRFEDEELPRVNSKTGKPQFAARTQKEYSRQIKATIRPRFAAMKVAPSEADAARGGYLRTMDIQQFVREGEENGRSVMVNRDASVMSTMFAWAKTVGLTEYNPCLGIKRNDEYPREQMPDDSMFLGLYGCASPQLQVWMDLVHMVGSRISDILRTMESDWSTAGLMSIPGKLKRGQPRKKRLFERTDDLAEVIERARDLKRLAAARLTRRKGSPSVGSVYLLPNPRTGEPYTLEGFESSVRRAKERLARLRLGDVATDAQVADFIRALNYHIHDGRARAIDDAHGRGEDATAFANHMSNTTTRRIYQGRGVTVLTPNPRIKGKAA